MSRWRSGGFTRVVAMAADPATAWIVLWLLGGLCLISRSLARRLAGNARLPRPLLWWLAPRRWDVRAAVAANPRCPQLLLLWMSLSHDRAVGAAVAGNPAASGRVLALVFRTSGPRERLYLAGNPSLPSALADRLLGGTDPFVRGAAAANPAASAAALGRLADGMTEAAWTLKRIAANPSCPAGLSDQLLTWISLGGAGNADPMFDPVECTGHPADTSVPAFSWYRDQAGRGRAEHHPLWRVRAEVLSAAGRLPARRAWVLARDPRPEVRRRIARARLSLNMRMELRRDADPEAARLARAAAPRARSGGSGSRARVKIRRLIAAALIAAAVRAAFYISDAGVSSPGPAGTGSPPGAPAESVTGLPGGGKVACTTTATGDRLVIVVQVSAGSRRLTLHFASNIYPNGTVLPGQPPDATVPPGQTARYQLPYGAFVLTVTAGTQGPPAEVALSAGGCG